jgi:hypothetical protein
LTSIIGKPVFLRNSLTAAAVISAMAFPFSQIFQQNSLRGYDRGPYFELETAKSPPVRRNRKPLAALVRRQQPPRPTAVHAESEGR